VDVLLIRKFPTAGQRIEMDLAEAQDFLVMMTEFNAGNNYGLLDGHLNITCLRKIQNFWSENAILLWEV